MDAVLLRQAITRNVCHRLGSDRGSAAYDGGTVHIGRRCAAGGHLLIARMAERKADGVETTTGKKSERMTRNRTRTRGSRDNTNGKARHGVQQTTGP